MAGLEVLAQVAKANGFGRELDDDDIDAERREGIPASLWRAAR